MGLKGVSILMYHQVGNFAPMSSHRSTYCHFKRFRLQMLTLKILGFKVLDIEDVLRLALGNASLKGPSVCLTFDDGYENFFEYAYPVLRRHGFPATVYILAGYIGRNALWFKRDGRDAPPLMSRTRIAALMKDGLVRFGSHGIGHRRLGEIDLEDARHEIEGSKAALENIFDVEFTHFCYPYGSYNKTVKDLVEEAGYESAVSCVRGTTYQGADPFQLPRKAISYGDSVLGFLWKIMIKNRRKQPEI